MIKLGPRPPRPKFFRSSKFKNFVDQLWQFHTAGGTRAQQEWFAWQEQMSPFMGEAMVALNTYFNGKCAYTEAPLVGEDGALLNHAQLVLHRPASDATGVEGSIDPDHYWWLIADWSNWYLASGSVASVKENRFPVDGRRAPVPKKRATKYRTVEKSLLLDPCQDDPVWYLQFWRSGVVGACEVTKGKSWPSRRLPSGLAHSGIHTIRNLDLNNQALISERKQVAVAAGRELTRLVVEGTDQAGVQKILSRDQPFAAAARQGFALTLLARLDAERGSGLLARLYGKRGRSSPSREMQSRVRQLVDELASEIAVAVICNQGKRRQFAPSTARLLQPIADAEGLTQRPEARELFLLALRGPSRERAGEPAPSMRPPEMSLEVERPVIDRSAHVRYLLVKNFKAIHEVELDTNDLGEDERTVTLEPAWGADGETPITSARRWWAFLGENGSGKSCLLQAIGLALAGENIDAVMQEARLTWKDLLRRPPGGSDEKVSRGRICLEFTNGVRIDLRFNENRHWWIPDRRGRSDESSDLPPRSGVPDIQTFIRGYGATRLLESGEEEPDMKPTMPLEVRVANLFDPRATVIDAEKWLVNLDEPDFNVVAPTIAGLLEDHRKRAGEGATRSPEPLLARKGGRVTLEGLPLNLVSDGYRAIVAMLCDIMAGLGEGVSSMQEAPGIVLIDEIGAHLHPRWRMSITRKMRRALPRVQFIVSTHEPLCLRGLFAKEVARVHKHEKHGVITEVVERSPSTYRVDQLLTSEFFGLETTIDPDLERRFHHYYRLRAIPEEDRDEQQQEDFRNLRRYLYEHARPSFGFTRRDQLICDEIDDLLSDEYREQPTQSREAYLEARKERRKTAMAKVRDIWELRSASYDLGESQ